MRDYGISNEIKGGTKGESADYLLYDVTGDQIQYVPVVNKFKLYKRRKTSLVDDGMPARSDTASHIVMAGRAYSRDEEKQITDTFTRHGGSSYRGSSTFVPFEGRDDIQDADRRVADLLKGMFTHHLPRVKLEDQDDFDAEMKHNDSEDDGELFGIDETERRRSRKIKERRSSYKHEAEDSKEEEEQEEEAKVQDAE